MFFLRGTYYFEFKTKHRMKKRLKMTYKDYLHGKAMLNLRAVFFRGKDQRFDFSYKYPKIKNSSLTMNLKRFSQSASINQSFLFKKNPSLECTKMG